MGLVGWEGLGISSFYLVAFSRSRSSIAGAIITIITNRLGDICYFVALGLGLLGVGALPVLVVLALAASTKRSQYPFRSWLPAAMAAPTPVSRLVHSRTLVTAGIYLLIRMGLGGFSMLGVLGAVTMVGGGVVAWLGQDAKKIVALSTLSQLGLMVFSLSSCREVITFNHLITHAYFKSLLFMCVGVLIHRCYGSQESRFSSDRVSPRARVLIGGTAALRMRGLVATTGARSKHMIMGGLEPAGALVSLTLFVVGAAMTTLYSAKLLRSLGGYRVSVSTVGSSSVGGSGVSPLVFSALRGMIFYSVSGYTVGSCGIHIPASSFFFFFVLFFLVVGSLVSVRIRRALWPSLSSAAGSLRFVGYEPKSAPIADVQSSAAISGWMGARSVLTALVYLTALLIYNDLSYRFFIFLTGHIYNLRPGIWLMGRRVAS